MVATTLAVAGIVIMEAVVAGRGQMLPLVMIFRIKVYPDVEDWRTVLAVIFVIYELEPDFEFV